jgi:hypothetical protein
MPIQAHPYPRTREALGPAYRKLSPEGIEALLESANIVAEDMEGFLDDLGNLGKSVAGALPSILPVAGTVIGTAYGGPAGGALGGLAGQAAGGAIGTALGRPSSPRPAPTPSMPQPAQPAPSQIQGPPPAAGKALQAMFNPAMLQALIAMLMGQVVGPQAGQQKIPVGANTAASPDAFTNMLSVLLNQASAEYRAAAATSGEAYPPYLLDYAGEPQGDLAVPEFRAQKLFELLQEADFGQDEAYREDSPELPALNDQFYDELELAQFLSDYEFQR